MDNQGRRPGEISERTLGAIYVALVNIHMEIRKMSAELDDLKAAVAAEDTVIGGAVTLLSGLAAQIDALAAQIAAGTATPADLTALSTDIKAETAALSNAIATNTRTPPTSGAATTQPAQAQPASPATGPASGPG